MHFETNPYSTGESCPYGKGGGVRGELSYDPPLSLMGSLSEALSLTTHGMASGPLGLTLELVGDAESQTSPLGAVYQDPQVILRHIKI